MLHTKKSRTRLAMRRAMFTVVMIGLALFVTYTESLVIVECELEDATERRGRLLVTVVDSKSGAERRGTVCSLYRKASLAQRGRYHAGAATHQFFSSVVARAACNHAGFASAAPDGDAFAIPHYGYASSEHDHLSVIDSLACPTTSVGATLGSCDFELADEECTANHDAGVVCPKAHYASATLPTRGNVTMFTAYSSLLSVRLLDVLRESLRNLLGHAAVEQMRWEEFENFASAVPYSAVKFYVADEQSSHGKNCVHLLYDPLDIEFALTSYARSPETVSQLFLCSSWLVEPQRPREDLHVTPNPLPWAAVAGGSQNRAAAAAATTTSHGQAFEATSVSKSNSSTSAANWSVRIVNNLGTSSATGRVELRSPGSNTWVRACASTSPSLSAVVALCKGALDLPQETSWKYATPLFAEQPPPHAALRPSDFVALQFDDHGGSPVDASLSEVLVTPLSTPHCTPIIVNCLRSVVEVTEDRLLTAVVAAHDFSQTAHWFSASWSYALPTGLNFVAANIDAVATVGNFTYVNFTFASLSAGGSTGNESSCTSARWNCSHPAGSSAHGSGEPGNGSSTTSGSSAHGAGSNSSRPSGGDADVSEVTPRAVEGNALADDPVTSYIDDNDGILYVGTMTRLATWYVARRMRYANITGFGTVYELWDNATDSTPQMSVAGRALRRWRWGTEQAARSLQLIDVVSADELQRGLRGEGAPMLGRPEVSLATSTAWGTIASDGTMAPESVKALCAALGAPTVPSARLPDGVFIGTGPVYLSDFTCSNTEENIPQCDYVVSQKYNKRNWATHDNDVSILCGSLRPNYAASLLMFALTVENLALYNESALSAMVTCYEERSGFAPNRLTLQGFVIDSKRPPSVTNGMLVEMNVSISPRNSEAQFTSGDILLVATMFGGAAAECMPAALVAATAVILKE